VRKRSTRVL